jgi:hypothetical protein
MYLRAFFLLVLTIKFNKQRARPDAAQDDFLSTFVTSQTSANEIGFRFVDIQFFMINIDLIILF